RYFCTRIEADSGFLPLRRVLGNTKSLSLPYDLFSRHAPLPRQMNERVKGSRNGREFLSSRPHHGTFGLRLSAPNAVIFVNGVASLPSAFITQMLKVSLVLRASLPSRARREAKTILLPSGDQIGSKLSAFGAVSLVNGMALVPSAFITQMSWVWLVLTASVPS